MVATMTGRSRSRRGLFLFLLGDDHVHARQLHPHTATATADDSHPLRQYKNDTVQLPYHREAHLFPVVEALEIVLHWLSTLSRDLSVSLLQYNYHTQSTDTVNRHSQ